MGPDHSLSSRMLKETSALLSPTLTFRTCHIQASTRFFIDLNNLPKSCTRLLYAKCYHRLARVGHLSHMADRLLVAKIRPSNWLDRFDILCEVGCQI